jgi:Permuted papain-like amidase enzyme, YaeF/YiiX, C92 family
MLPFPRAEEAVRLERALSDALVRFLTLDVRNYQRRIPNDLDNLKKHIRPGDVLLIEGKTRIAQIIKYITQSSWSHSSIYVGDRPLQKDTARYQELYGAEARHLVIEADLENGVFAVPLSKYVDYNVRVCRPYCLTDEDRDRVVDEVVAHIGDQYDRRQLVDLGRYLTPFHLLPMRWRRKAFFSGQSDSRAVICSSLIAQAFSGVRYPILPVLPESLREAKADGHYPWGRRIRNPHPRLVLPRDFDLSPYFRIVKFNSVEEGPFDYRQLEWLEPQAVPPRPDSVRENT